MPASKTQFAGLTANTFLLALASFFGDVATEMLYPVLPLFLTTVVGTSAAMIGVIEGVAPGRGARSPLLHGSRPPSGSLCIASSRRR